MLSFSLIIYVICSHTTHSGSLRRYVFVIDNYNEWPNKMLAHYTNTHHIQLNPTRSNDYVNHRGFAKQSISHSNPNEPTWPWHALLCHDHQSIRTNKNVQTPCKPKKFCACPRGCVNRSDSPDWGLCMPCTFLTPSGECSCECLGCDRDPWTCCSTRCIKES